ncbi:hypothetical protein ACFL6I_14435 [candidate division KSB1 bacterium]
MTYPNRNARNAGRKKKYGNQYIAVCRALYDLNELSKNIQRTGEPIDCELYQLVTEIRVTTENLISNGIN